MKRKIFSSLLVLVLLCMPMLCLTGCQSENDDVLFKVEGTAQIALNGSFANITGLTFQANYYLQKWDKDEGKYRYVRHNTSKPEGYEFLDEKGYYFENDLTTLGELIANGMTYSGFDSSKTDGKCLKKGLSRAKTTKKRENIDKKQPIF